MIFDLLKWSYIKNWSKLKYDESFDDDFRDIMNALENIKEIVKATEFIGQSSGYNLVPFFICNYTPIARYMCIIVWEISCSFFILYFTLKVTDWIN